MKEAVLIYPHQLFEHHPALSKSTLVFLVEEPLLFTQYSFHKQKLVFHRATMKAYEAALIAQGHTVVYVETASLKDTKDIAALLKHHSVTSVTLCDVVDDWLSIRLIDALSKAGIVYTFLETPMFLTSREALDSYFRPLIRGKKRLLMKSFYEWQRKRLDVLITPEGAPLGGAWSYDTENRKRLPKGVELPPVPAPSTSPYVTEAHAYVGQHFGENYGDMRGFFYPVTHEEADAWLHTFLRSKLADFGPYEDAITERNGILFHSVLSPLLNSGLLTPEYVLKETLAYAKHHQVPIASLEGFIRQLIGWREYIRAVYVYLGRKVRTSNYFEAQRNIPASFWTGHTGIQPVDDTITNLLSTAYSHHIPRLMIMGNVMNLCGFHPDQVYRWFMEMYIDAYDWVMVPNVYSMTLYADGGLITTKPYISGSSYIHSMSDYKKDEWSAIWDALFWNFVDTHFEKLSKESRLGFIAVTYQKMTPEKRSGYKRVAEQFLAQLGMS